MAAEVEVVVSISGEDILAGRLWAHRSRGQESATFSYEESYLGLEGAYELDPRLPSSAVPSRPPRARRSSLPSLTVRPTAGGGG